jgi:hypothetical protein
MAMLLPLTPKVTTLRLSGMHPRIHRPQSLLDTPYNTPLLILTHLKSLTLSTVSVTDFHHCECILTLGPVLKELELNSIDLDSGSSWKHIFRAFRQNLQLTRPPCRIFLTRETRCLSHKS